MKNIKHDAALWLNIGLVLSFWMVVLYVSKTPFNINVEAFKKLPDTVTLYVIAVWVFERFLWKWGLLQGWLVPFPNLEGTWKGKIQSTWIDPATDQPKTAFPVTLVITQSFSEISILMYSEESNSHSTSAQFTKESGDEIYLNFNYTNRSKALLAEKSPAHDGSARLKVITKPSKELEGTYWTSRCSNGDVSARFVAEEKDQKYRE